MHGREGECTSLRHMRPVHSPAQPSTSALAAPPHPVSSPLPATVISDQIDQSFFLKDGRKFHVGDCALFQAGNSPPFIGIICWFVPGHTEYPQLGVNWLYRPSDTKLAKGISVEAAPNEIFYSFHKDEISAASLLHPCKVAFLCKGIELPPGISSFVCWRVYDTTNKCLWWLTDKDYVDERQEEVNRLLERTRQEMHVALSSGGRSPKQLSSRLSLSDSGQNGSSVLSSQAKGKKRVLEKGDVGSESMKRESTIKTEIAKITEKGGLMNNQAVEKFVQLMELDRSERKIDVAGRVLLANVITVTDKNDCLSKFVQLRGIHVLDDWLQEAHKGKNGGEISPRGTDKSVDELLIALLRALDKLPIDLDALQACNIGKSVNHLRSHKNMEIQKRAKGLFDTWKKRVDADMKKIEMAKLSDGKSGGLAPGIHSKGSVSQPSSCKSLPSKECHGDSVMKSSSTFSASSTKAGGSNAVAEPSSMAVKEEKGCSSDQSISNSQSCSKEDIQSSAAGSANSSKTGGMFSRHRRSNGFGASASSAAQKSRSDPEKSADNGNGHRLMVRLSNTKRSPSWSASGGFLEDRPALSSRPSSPRQSEKNELVNQKTKSKSDSSLAANISSTVKAEESWQSNDVKGDDQTPTSLLNEDHEKNTNEAGKSVESASVPVNDLSENFTRDITGEPSSGGKMSKPPIDNEAEVKSKVLIDDKMNKIPHSPENDEAVVSEKLVCNEVSASLDTEGNSIKPVEVKASDCPVYASPIDIDISCGIDCPSSLPIETKEGTQERKTCDLICRSASGLKRKTVGVHHEIDVPETEDAMDSESGSATKTSPSFADEQIQVAKGADTPPFSEVACPDDVTARSSPTHATQEAMDEDKNEKSTNMEMKRQSELIEKNDLSNPSHDGSEEDSPKTAARDLSSLSTAVDEFVVNVPREVAASPEASSSSAAMLGFDLNEGLSGEEGVAPEPVSTVVGSSSVGFLPKLPLFPALPVHITVAAPAKGPFVPPEDLLRGKSEGGWKGSAATSAFRPAEPRRAMEMSNADPMAGIKRSRPRLDIDLNVTDEFPAGGSVDMPSRSSGGLDLDLNRMDEGIDSGFPSASTSRRQDLAARSKPSGFSDFRDFDLNNGPGIDEFVQDLLPQGVKGGATSSSGNLAFLPALQTGSTYPALAMPSFLPVEQGDQPYQVNAALGGQPMWSSGMGGGAFGSDFYRASVLASSPAMPFSYAAFPFAGGYPLPPNSFSGGASASYVESGPGQPFMAAPPSAVPPSYVKPFVINIPDGSAMAGGGADSSRKWGWQGFDLNAGPGGLEIDAREAAASRSTLASQVLKRKDPEGGWDSEKFTYRPPPWQ